MEVTEREDYLPISKEEVLARVNTKIKSYRKDWIKSMAREDFIEYDKVKIKEDTVSIGRSYRSKQPSGGIFIKVESHPQGSILKTKIYIYTDTSNFFKYFLGGLVLLVSILVQLWEFSIGGIFLTLLIELVIFIYPAILSLEGTNNFEFYYQLFLREIKKSEGNL
ncbi:MAG: hypothetical protein ACK5RG_03890 [Cyclobacteriaceae bacterium]|jgi:hypothetical protein|nr:hypothetical protein [Flammeovirgaceae bacterium]